MWPSAVLSFKALISGYFAATCGSLAFALQERRKNPAAEDRCTGDRPVSPELRRVFSQGVLQWFGVNGEMNTTCPREESGFLPVGAKWDAL